MDFVIPPRRTTEDESLGYMIERRLGAEVLENLTEPLLAGIYAGDMRRLSLQATFPQFGEVERDYGSLIRGMMTGRKPAETHTGTKRSAFLNFRQGLQSLVHALVHELQDVDQRLNTSVQSLDVQTGDSARYSIQLNNGEYLEADDVVITVPTYVASELLQPHVDTAALDAINYVSVANVVLAFEKKISNMYLMDLVSLFRVRKAAILQRVLGHQPSGFTRARTTKYCFVVMLAVRETNRMWNCRMMY